MPKIRNTSPMIFPLAVIVAAFQFLFLQKVTAQESVPAEVIVSDESVQSASAVFDLAETIPESPPVRVVTKEELALHDGKQSKEYWLSCLSEIYDVTAGAPEWYEEDKLYHIFIGRDANVPFITGNFTVEEANKPLSILDNHDFKMLQEYWLKFYQDEERYPFVGYLLGDLYDEQGKPTYAHYEIQEKIREAKRKTELEKERVRKEIEQRNIRMAEQEARERWERGERPPRPPRDPNDVLYVIGPWQYWRSKS